jgi:predicted phosphodiesterase
MASTDPARIALIGDVHANLPALEAVLKHARDRGVTGIWNIGDFLGYGAFPDEVVRLLRQVEALSIIGNYDLKALNFPRKEKKWRGKKHPLKWLAFKFAYEQLSEASLDYLGSLPEAMVATANDKFRIPSQDLEGIRKKEFLLVHASPASNEEALAPDTPDDRLVELNQLALEKYRRPFAGIIFGHSHQGFARQIGGTWFINTGSVGRPDDGDPRACYAVLEVAAAAINVEHFRVEYDVERAVVAIREKGLPEAFAEMLIQGRELEAVLEGSE